jgi:hypothetical protein
MGVGAPVTWLVVSALEFAQHEMGRNAAGCALAHQGGGKHRKAVD